MPQLPYGRQFGLEGLLQATALAVLRKAFQRNDQDIARKNRLVYSTETPATEQLILAETLGSDVELRIALKKIPGVIR